MSVKKAPVVITKADLDKQRKPVVEPPIKVKTYQDGLDEGNAIGRKEGFADGEKSAYKIGFKSGEEKGITSGRKAGLTEGYRQGYADGHPQGYREGGLYISHKYVAAIELKLAEIDGYKDAVKWRKEAKIPAWWIGVIMSMYDPLDSLPKKKQPTGEPVKDD